MTLKSMLAIAIFMGFSLLMFGVLKFFSPFNGWYSTQIVNSGLGEYSFWAGISGEIAVGLTFLATAVLYKRISRKTFKWMHSIAASLAIVMMLTAIYVHLHPNVPAAVLPLKIKAPYIPAFFILLSLTDIFLVQRQRP